MSVLEKVKNVVRRRPRQLDLESYIEKMKRKGYDKDGNFIADPTPIAPPIGYTKHPSMVEIVRDMVQSEKLRQAALDAGLETLEEAEDFDIPDEPEILRSPYENANDPAFRELVEAGREAIKRKQAEQKHRKSAPSAPEDDAEGRSEPGATKQPPGDAPPTQPQE